MNVFEVFLYSYNQVYTYNLTTIKRGTKLFNVFVS